MKPKSPGEILLKKFLQENPITQEKLAKHINCDYKVINRIVNGKTRITPKMSILLAAALATKPQYWLDLQMEWDLYQLRKDPIFAAPPSALCKPLVYECLPEGLELMEKESEKMRKEYRKYLLSGKSKRRSYGRRYLDLPEKLLEKLEYVFRIFKEQGNGYTNLSDFVQDAILEHLFSLEDNGELEPIYFEPWQELNKALSEGTSTFIKEVLKRVPKNMKRKRLVEILKKKFKTELQHASSKTLANLISYHRNRNIADAAL